MAKFIDITDSEQAELALEFAESIHAGWSWKTTDQIAAAINRNGWHIRKDGKPVTSAQVYAVICRYPSIFTKEAGRICVML